MDHAQTNDQQQFGMVPNSVDVLTYEQLERSTCPCRDTSATRVLKVQHETFSSNGVRTAEARDEPDEDDGKQHQMEHEPR